MNDVFYDGYYVSPDEAIIKAYNNGHGVQKVVNAILEAEIPGYSYNRVCSLMRTYRKLIEEGKFSKPADIELEEDDVDESKAVKDGEEVFYMGLYCSPVEVIIKGYEHDESPSTIMKTFKEDGIKNFTVTRIRNIMKTYKRLLAEDDLRSINDAEILADMTIEKKAENSTKNKNDEEEEVEKTERKKIPARKQGKPVDPKKLSASAEKELTSDPSPEFKKMKSNVATVAKGILPALIISGRGGVGKTYTVCKTLDDYGKKGEFYEVIKGKSTAAALYDFLWTNRDKVCVIDDCDSVFGSADGISLLKGALDSGECREISWISKASGVVKTSNCKNNEEIADAVERWNEKHDSTIGIPSKFYFQGAIIFITNKTKQEIHDKDEALLTRCTVTEVNLNQQQILNRLKQVLGKMKITGNNGQDITNSKIKTEVFNWISSDKFLKDPRFKGKTVSFRLFINTYKQCYAGNDDWKEMSFDNQ